MSEELTIADYEAVLADHRRLVRRLDVALNGEAGAAKQASLCDIVGQLEMAGDCDHPQINKATERWNICPDCGQTWPRGLAG